MMGDLAPVLRWQPGGFVLGDERVSGIEFAVRRLFGQVRVVSCGRENLSQSVVLTRACEHDGERRQRTLTLSESTLTSSVETVSYWRTLVRSGVHVVSHRSSVLSAVSHLIGGLLYLGK